MTDKKFNVGDTVVERFPSANYERGVVREAYELAAENRYVVHFESGREAVLFENELTSTTSHIQPHEVARRAGFRLNQLEEEHVRQCEECQRVLEDFVGRINKPDKPEDL
jgi:hypothetical protein